MNDLKKNPVDCDGSYLNIPPIPIGDSFICNGLTQWSLIPLRKTPTG